MSDKQKRKKKQRERIAEAAAALAAGHRSHDYMRFVETLQRLAEGNFRVWQVVEGLALDEEWRFAVAQIVAPDLAASTGGAVHKRRAKGNLA